MGMAGSSKHQGAFGDAEGALKAIETGLALVPGDPEFLTARREIESGSDILQLSNHLIDPDADEALQRNQMPSDELLVYTRFNNCILAKPDGLEAVFALFNFSDWQPGDPPKCLLYGAPLLRLGFAGLSVLNECSGAFTRLCWMARRFNPCCSSSCLADRDISASSTWSAFNVRQNEEIDCSSEARISANLTKPGRCVSASATGIWR